MVDRIHYLHLNKSRAGGVDMVPTLTDPDYDVRGIEMNVVEEVVDAFVDVVVEVGLLLLLHRAGPIDFPLPLTCLAVVRLAVG